MQGDVVIRLELIAAKSKQLASDVRDGKLWRGDLDRGVQEIYEQLARVKEQQ